MLTKTIVRASWMLVFFLMSLSCTSQEKIALIVAIGDYPEDGGWMKISSENDVPLVKNALLQQGFSEENIAIIQDSEATNKGIMEAIRTHLVKKAQKGSIAFFHYSGHGQQVADNGYDEVDGYDEALVPYDSPIRYIAGEYEGENLIRDEEIGELFDETRAKLGPDGNLLVLIDACHSGTGTRGMAKARGTDFKMAPEGYKPPSHRGTPETNAMEGATAVGSAPMVAFFGAAPHQLNFETKDDDGNGVGSLSYAFSKRFSTADKNTSYNVLFEQIKLEMSSTAPRQQPQAEGLLDQEILGGNMVEKVNYYGIEVNHDRTTIIMEAGWLQGVQEGSKIGIYPAETMAHGGVDPIAIGFVEKSRAMESNVLLEEPLEGENASGYLAVVLERGFGDISVGVKIDLPGKEEIINSFRAKMEKYPILKETEDAELFIISNNGQIELITKDGYVLESKSASNSGRAISTPMVRKMISYGQAKFLRDLEVTSYHLPLEFEIIPVKYDTNAKEVTENIPIESKMDGAGNLHFQDGDFLQIRVTNLGEKIAYFTFLDIQPDNVVTVLIPELNEVPADFQIGPGDSRIVRKVFKIGPPSGTEVFKLIATDEAIDLRPIIATRGNTSRDPNPNPNPFEKLFAESYCNETSTRGTHTISLGASKVNVFSRVFVID